MSGNGPHSKLSLTVDPLMVDLLPAYFARRTQDAKTIRNAISAKEFDLVRHLGHRMKGSGAGYGSPEISEIGGRLESAAGNKNAGDSLRCVHELEIYLAGLDIDDCQTEAADGSEP